jgi:CRP/FNR family transcriptional regulator, cyclic AMP receptor protein
MRRGVGACNDRGSMDTERLQAIAIFSGISKRELERLAQWTDQITVPPGYELAREGQFAHEFFVIESGTAEVVQGGNRIAQLGPGDFFGEIGLLETERRTASVIAETKMDLIVMFQREFRQMERELPPVADRIRAAIRARLDS